MKEEKEVPKRQKENFCKCAYCGRRFQTGQLAWDEKSNKFVCRQCLAEGKSCGCADDD